MNNRTLFKKARQALILDSIDFAGYDIDPTKSDINNLYTIFKAEMSWAVERAGQFTACESWLRGLASACTVPYDNYAVCQWAVSVGILPHNASETVWVNYPDKYWSSLASELSQMFNKVKA